MIYFFAFNRENLFKVYGKITTFPKKEATFQRWAEGDTIEKLAKKLRVAEATVEIYCLDMLAKGRGDAQMVHRILQELEVCVEAEHFHKVEQELTRRTVTLREVHDKSELRYNQIRAVIVALMYRQ